jgi:hypothetical protein
MDVFSESRSMQIQRNHNFKVSLKGYVVQKIVLITEKIMCWNFQGLRIGVSVKCKTVYGFVWVPPSIDSLKYLWSIEQVVPQLSVAEASEASRDTLYKDTRSVYRKPV